MSLTVAIVVSVGTVMGLSGYLITNKSSRPPMARQTAPAPEIAGETSAITSEPELAIDGNVANWETYQNKDFGFSWKYPKEFPVHAIGPNEVRQEGEEDEEKGPEAGVPSFDTVFFGQTGAPIR